MLSENEALERMRMIEVISKEFLLKESFEYNSNIQGECKRQWEELRVAKPLVEPQLKNLFKLVDPDMSGGIEAQDLYETLQIVG
mmetsp:Transcript_116445/g.250171  ORF Transcript_116445/g.250171 Transcript_116445/m.250171 type:complete len:84 (+) Transcript_116445:471-722(+)